MLVRVNLITEKLGTLRSRDEERQNFLQRLKPTAEKISFCRGKARSSWGRKVHTKFVGLCDVKRTRGIPRFARNDGVGEVSGGNGALCRCVALMRLALTDGWRVYAMDLRTTSARAEMNVGESPTAGIISNCSTPSLRASSRDSMLIS